MLRKYAYHYRYDTQRELELLNQLWPLVNDVKNFFTPTIKPIGWGEDQHGKRKRLYDDPLTPLDRLLASGVVTDEHQHALLEYRAKLNPAALMREINDIQLELIALAKPKTDALHLAVENRNKEKTYVRKIT